jgi:hypothetical protein
VADGIGAVGQGGEQGVQQLAARRLASADFCLQRGDQRHQLFDFGDDAGLFGGRR